MRNGIVFLAVAGVFVLLPSVADAQFFGPIVPQCEGAGSGVSGCQACHFVQLGQNILLFLVSIGAFLAGIVFAVGGIKLVTAGGDESQVSEAKRLFENAIIGFVIVLAAWLLIDTVLKVMLPTQESGGSAIGIVGNLGPWNQIQCARQPEFYANGRVTATGYNESQLSEEQVQQFAEAALSGPYSDQICQLAEANGMGEHCAVLQAQMHQESGGNTDAISSANAQGLMQLLPGTARDMCNQSTTYSCSGMSDTEIASQLRNDPTFNMTMGVMYMQQGLQETNGDMRQALAYYNGGPQALNESSTCPGQTWWECTANEGYAETRNYVSNILSVSSQQSGTVQVP